LTPSAELELVEIGNGVAEQDCLVWDEHRSNPALGFALASLGAGFPVPLGVLRAVEAPSYEAGVLGQIRAQVEKRGGAKLEDLLRSGDVWNVS
jgi:2-oxoglutarate ferredoxin oxidoreductase subunit beta